MKPSAASRDDHRKGIPEERIARTLETYFGYQAFLPYQEAIINDVLEGRDVLAVMATGGGKSLCFQLPALLLDGLTVVVSPLISLMKDQVDALLANGIPAATLNSSLGYTEKSATEQALENGHIKILYISPERLTQQHFLDILRHAGVSLIAVDEAHCISMWGHQFRPEYRQLRVLKEHFPGVPLIALTATAIPSVQQDIIDQLNLDCPSVYIGSFNRKNLFYRVMPKRGMEKALFAYVRDHPDDAGIIYCFSQKSTVDLAEKLRSRGFRALPYHAGLPDSVRSETQEKFIRGDVEIICATIAFGMGIDKPDVRYVIHADLPKNIEAYYQETGRAGRDGEPSDCILFFGRGDYGKIKYIIEREYTDPTQKQVAYRKLNDMLDYCESPACRRAHLLRYFGETYEGGPCNACDRCLSAPATFDGREVARRILSCISRVNGRYGAAYIADIICGSKSRRILSSGHDRLPEYGTGQGYPRSQWLAFIRELVQRGYLDSAGDAYPVLRMNAAGREVLAGSIPVHLTLPEPPEHLPGRDDEEYDRVLFSELRRARKVLADREGVPPYVILHDRTLREMAASYPGSAADLRNLHGMSENKVQKYGDAFLAIIGRFCRGESGIPPSLPRTPGETSPKSAGKPLKTAARVLQATLDLYREGLSIEEIAERRGLRPETVTSHLARLIERGEGVPLDRLVEPAKQRAILRALETADTPLLKPLRERLGNEYTYEEIRLVRARYLREQKMQDQG